MAFLSISHIYPYLSQKTTGIHDPIGYMIPYIPWEFSSFLLARSPMKMAPRSRSMGKTVLRMGISADLVGQSALELESCP